MRSAAVLTHAQARGQRTPVGLARGQVLHGGLAQRLPSREQQSYERHKALPMVINNHSTARVNGWFGGIRLECLVKMVLNNQAADGRESLFNGLSPSAVGPPEGVFRDPARAARSFRDRDLVLATPARIVRQSGGVRVGRQAPAVAFSRGTGLLGRSTWLPIAVSCRPGQQTRQWTTPLLTRAPATGHSSHSTAWLRPAHTPFALPGKQRVIPCPYKVVKG